MIEDRGWQVVGKDAWWCRGLAKVGGGRDARAEGVGPWDVCMSACDDAMEKKVDILFAGMGVGRIGSCWDGGFSRHNNPNRLSAWGDPPAQRASCQHPRVSPAAMVAGFRSLPAAAPAAAAASSTSPPSEPRLRP